MQKKHSLAYYIVIFVIVQVIWLSIAGLWISRFIINNVRFNKIGEEYAIQIPDGGAVAILVIGLSLLVLALAGMSMLFRFLNVQFNLARLYDNFIANITHELKTPISSMQIAMDTIKTRNLDQNTQQKFLANIEEGTQKLKNLIDNILVISRLEQKVQIFDCGVVEAEDLIKENIKKLAAEYAVHIHLTSDLTPKTTIVFNKMAFFLIMKNLVDNSIKYSKHDVRILINLSHHKKWIKIVYQDNGSGIPPKMHRKIFRKFYRGKNRNISNVKGTGLGLYLVRELVKYHGGKIKILKNKEKQGTTFQIKLPQYPLKKKKYLKKLLS